MAAELFRVDNRLIHGQVLEAWVPRVRAQAILVVDEEASGDDFQRSILEAMGQGVIEVVVVAPAGAARALEQLGLKRTIVLFKSIGQALAAYKAGLKIPILNLGNIHPCECSVTLTPSVNLSEGDIASLEKLLKEDVKIEARAVPSEAGPDVACFCRNPGVQ